MALENAKLVEVAKREAQHAKELEIARDVQRNLFPKNLPAREAGSLPRSAVRRARWAAITTTFSKWIPRAWRSRSGTFRERARSRAHDVEHPRDDAERAARCREPSRFVESLNDHLVNSTSAEMFATLFCRCPGYRHLRVLPRQRGHNPDRGGGGSAEVSRLDAAV